MVDWTSVFLFIAGVVVTFLGGVSKYLFDKSQDHEKRIQKMEDLHGDKIDVLEKKIDKLETAINSLADNINKGKNQEGQLTEAISALIKHLEKNDNN